MTGRMQQTPADRLRAMVTNLFVKKNLLSTHGMLTLTQILSSPTNIFAKSLLSFLTITS